MDFDVSREVVRHGQLRLAIHLKEIRCYLFPWVLGKGCTDERLTRSLCCLTAFRTLVDEILELPFDSWPPDC